MKQHISLVVVVLLAISGKAQIENINISPDSSFVMDRLYTGMLSGTAFDVTKASTTSFVNFRVGAMVTWKASKVFSLRSFGMLETDTHGSSGIQQWYVTITPNKHWLFTVGQMATISTEQRPHPVSGGGQFETITQSRVPGGAPGIKAKYVGPVSVGVGIAARNGFPEYHGSFAKGNHTISGYYRLWDDQSGFAYTYDTKKFYSIVVYIPHTVVSTTTAVSLTKDYTLFADVGYSTVDRSVMRMEGGVFKKFTSKWIQGLISMTYDIETKCVNGYLFIHL